MTNATIILSTRQGYKDSVIFVTPRGSFYVNEFTDGIAVLDPSCGTNIKDFAALVAGCFDPMSNFHEELKICFKTEDDLKAIKFEANDIVVTATKENDAEWIWQEWKRLEEEEWERYQKEQEEYHKTWEYKLKHAKELKAEYRQKEVEEKIKVIAQQTEMEFKDEAAKARWEEIVEMNSHDGYSESTCEYAEYWAKFMQHLMKDGAELTKIAKETSRAADMFGMSGFTYGYAVSILCECWKYGDELRRWHNKMWGAPEDAEGVVNPAILVVSVG